MIVSMQGNWTVRVPFALLVGDGWIAHVVAWFALLGAASLAFLLTERCDEGGSMSCCGGKRAQLSAGWRTKTTVAEVEPTPGLSARFNRPRMFEYLGQRSVTLRGAVTGTFYHFDHRGHRIEIAADDVFGMMGERDMRPALARD
jgi:hypothetical protein